MARSKECMYLNSDKIPDKPNVSTYTVDKGKHKYEFNMQDFPNMDEMFNASKSHLTKQGVDILVSAVLSSDEFKYT